MIKGYQEQILKMYDKIREKQKEELEKRKNEIQKKFPEIMNIERQIGKLCIDVSINALKNVENRDKYLNELKEKITDLRVKKSELLVSNGYDMNYLNLHYNCPKCKDTGFIGAEKCSCYDEKLVYLYYKNSDLKDVLQTQNFENFNLDYYDTHRTDSNPDSPRKNMEKILSKTQNFIKQFKTSKENLLFYGSSGTGKTFLSYCIAKELLDQGFLVIYRTAEDLMKDLKEVRFNNAFYIEELLINCDLLILDDLGTEQSSDFSRTELFNFLNKKLLKNKKMVISTNLPLESLLKSYSERITSRLLGNFNICKFYGNDIRIKLNLDKNK